MAERSSILTRLKKNSLLFALMTGMLVSIAVTTIVMIMEWSENPSGIFHDETGTHWGFVLDTVFSWIVPTFLTTGLIAFLLHLVWLAFCRVMARNFGASLEETAPDEDQV